MTLLEAVNLVLRKIGEIPVTSVDEQYSTLTIALPALEEARVRLLSEGYWFNTFYSYQLAPTVTGEALTPADCLKFFPQDDRFSWIGERVRMTEDGSVFVNAVVVGRLIIDIPFEQLPEVCQYAIAYSAAYDTYVSDIGDDDIAKNLGARRDEFLEQLNGDHTVSRNQNSRTRKQVLRWRRALRTGGS
jgi:hypothetical protein